MARITDNLLVQRVGDDKIVMIDESAGQEFVFPLEVAPNVAAALTYLYDPARGAHPSARVEDRAP